MNNETLFALKHISLQSAFGKEDEDFTPWLSNNLNRLSKALGIPEMIKQRTEVTLSTLRPDIIAYTDPTEGDEVIIENQYGKSDSNHVGKLLSYAAYEGARYAILICEEAREEHKKAIDALNEKGVCGCNFFLVCANCYQIDNSPLAIEFNVVCRPAASQDTAKEKEIVQVLSSFWAAYIDKAREKGIEMYAKRKSSKEHWLAGYIGKSSVNFISRIKKDACSVGLWFGDAKAEINTKNFNVLLRHKDEIEQEFGDTLLWEDDPAKKMCKIEYQITGIGGYLNRDNWPAVIDKMLNCVEALHRAITPFAHWSD